MTSGRQHAEITEGRSSLHHRIVADDRANADDAVGADVDGPEFEPAIFNRAVGQAGFDAECGVLADGDQIKRGQIIAGQVGIAADCCPHQSKVDIEQRRSGEEADRGEGDDLVYQPPA